MAFVWEDGTGTDRPYDGKINSPYAASTITVS
jgi:hypothetical protein